MADGFRDQFRQAVKLGQVGLQDPRAARPRRFQLRGQRVHVGRRAAVMQGQVVAGRVQPARDRRADAAGRAGDECAAAGAGQEALRKRGRG